MRKAIKDILTSLSQRDIEALQSIYLHRCLTEEQLYQLHYNKALPEEKVSSHKWVKRKVRQLLKLGLIEEVEYISKKNLTENSYVYFLTSLGIELIRYCLDLPTNIYDKKKRIVKRGYYTASELKIYPKNINHQIHINEFVLNFQKQTDDLTWKYYDEKFMSQFTNIRPDGMLSMLDTDFFIEMDMATESKKQLYEKWENYRNFFLSREYLYKEKKIIVLFICEGTTRIEERIDLVKHTLFERLMDILDKDIEFYIGSSEAILSLLKNRLIPQLKGEKQSTPNLLEQHGFRVANGRVLQSVIPKVEFTWYIQKTTNTGQIVVEGNQIQEFLVDDFIQSPISVFSKISYLDKHSMFFRDAYGRSISYVIVGQSEEELYKEIKLMDLIGVPNVYYSTHERLSNRSFGEALFQFDYIGNLHHFTNNELSAQVFEKNMQKTTE